MNSATAHPTLRHPWLLLVLLAGIVAFSFQGSRGLFETTEGRYAESAREMIASGNYLEPTLAGRPHWTKPPLTYWTIAGGLALLGRNAWGARLANAVAFVLTVLAVAALGAAVWDHATGFVAGLVYASSLFPAVAAANLSTDTLLALWETLAVLCFVRAFRAERSGEARWWVRGMWLAFGLGFLTKGPPALLPLLALLAFRWVARRRTGRNVRLVDPLGFLLFATVGLGWYLVEVLRTPGLLAMFVGDEVVGRALTDRFHRNPEWYKPFIIYLPVLFFGAGVWLPAGVRLLRREGLLRPRALLQRLGDGTAGSLLLLWLLLPLALFFGFRSRLPLYVLPLYTPIALAIGRELVRETARSEAEVGPTLTPPSPNPFPHQLGRGELQPRGTTNSGAVAVLRTSCSGGVPFPLSRPLIYSRPRIPVKSTCSRSNSAKRTRSGRSRSSRIVGISS